MKILVISESFNNGGLETHIKTIYENLNNDVEMVFAFGNYTEKIKLENAKIYSGFHLSYMSTIQEFREDVDRLVDIIIQENIDVIHVHPYYSLFPAIFASQITNKKLIYTYHGLGSFNFTKTVTSSALFYNAIEEKIISKIFSVSDYGINCFKNLDYENTVLFPNPIDVSIFKDATVINNNKWALFSRIDVDKFDELKMVIKDMSTFDIDSIDIYGSGSMIADLESFITDNGLCDKVQYKGYSTNIYDTLNGNYNGVIGIGRVLIEALTMGYPTIMIGYGKITGYVNYEIYNDIKNKNFINKDLCLTNLVMPTNEEILNIQSDIISRCSVTNILQLYIEEINSAQSKQLRNIIDLYERIKNLCDNNLLANCSFYKEREVYKLIKQYIGKYSLSCVVDNMITTADMLYELFDVNFSKVQEVRGIIENEKN